MITLSKYIYIVIYIQVISLIVLLSNNNFTNFALGVNITLVIGIIYTIVYVYTSLKYEDDRLYIFSYKVKYIFKANMSLAYIPIVGALLGWAISYYIIQERMTPNMYAIIIGVSMAMSQSTYLSLLRYIIRNKSERGE